MSFLLKDLSDLDIVAKGFLKKMYKNKVFAFYGEMGAGKTTFIKAICRAMGVTANVTSPTFSLVNEYEKDDGKPIYHFDFYRIKSIEEVYDLGYEDYFYSGNICFIEWPELIEAILPENVVKVQITVDKNDQRLISLN